MCVQGFLNSIILQSQNYIKIHAFDNEISKAEKQKYSNHTYSNISDVEKGCNSQQSCFKHCKYYF